MTGQVLDYSIQTNEGIISGDDGVRYTFSGAEWPVGATPARGVPVDFEVRDGGRAAGIYLIEMTAPPAAVASQETGAGKDRRMAAQLALSLGVFGVHKFYLGEKGGALRIILSCTIIGLAVSGILALLDAVKLIQMTDADFNRRYNGAPAPATAGPAPVGARPGGFGAGIADGAPTSLAAATPDPDTGRKPNRKLIVAGALALVVLFAVSCGVCAATGTDVDSCHYDATTNTSIITEGQMDGGGNFQSSSRLVSGNACD